MRTIYLCWVDDIPGYPKSFDGHFEILKQDYNVLFDVDEHTSTRDFDVIARNIKDDLVCLIDYNLKEHNGVGMNGNEVIAIIRQNNTDCKIIFYSSKATQEELRELVKDYENIICTTREEGLRNILTDLANGNL